MGQVLTGGLGQNPARQAAMKAGIPKEKPAYIVNQVCGSGIRSVASAFQSIKNNESKILYSNSLSDYDIDDFVAVQYTYNVETSENNIPYEIYNFKNGILSINIINQPIEIGTLSFYANCNKF